MELTVWLANIVSILTAISLLLFLVNRYISKPLRGWIERLVKELQTSDHTTLGGLVERMSNDVHALKETTNGLKDDTDQLKEDTRELKTRARQNRLRINQLEEAIHRERGHHNGPT